MTKKQPPKKPTKSERRAGPPPHPSSPDEAAPTGPMPRILLEQTLADLGKLLQSKRFESIDEANTFLQNLTAGGGQIPHLDPETPAEKAQALIYQAHETRSARHRADLARQALAIYPDCADAYELLARQEKSPEKRLALLEQGMAAGERAIGPENFKAWEGEFWDMIETRPYMRACAGVAELSWLLGQRPRAIDIYSRMLRLNPGDNQGVRYMLTHCLLEAGDDAALARLLKQYDDDGAANWAYSRALMLFRTDGAGQPANQALAEAFQSNPFIPEFLLGTRRLPKQLPEYIGFGDENEAISYAAFARRAWAQTPGALDWLRAQSV
ncbi:MAG: hypothetical protein M1546_10785 [Chloroflexi bacterium]|nr:hypothetical protein [Chloroflexota bacterium]